MDAQHSAQEALDARAKLKLLLDAALDRALSKGSSCGYASDHEFFGVLYEEAVIEVGKAMHDNSEASMFFEALDVAAVAMKYVYGQLLKGRDWSEPAA